MTVDIDEGTTPFAIECKADKKCDGTMYSSFYRTNQLLTPEFEWYKPKSIDDYPEEHREIMRMYIDNGGLDIRRKRR